MNKALFFDDEYYPYYFMCSEDSISRKYADEVELTDSELEWVKNTLEESNKVQLFIKQKIKEAKIKKLQPKLDKIKSDGDI